MSRLALAGLEDLEVEARSIFGTPVAVQVLPEAEALNAALRPAILARAGEASGLPGEGWRSAPRPVEWGGEALATVIAAAKALADVLDSSAPATDPSALVAMERLEPGQGITLGSAPGARWCARYVVDDGGAAARPELGGRFEAQDPRGVAPVMYAPQLSIAGAGGLTLGISQTVGLPSGALLVHPGWLLQGIEPYRGDSALLALTIHLGA